MTITLTKRTVKEKAKNKTEGAAHVSNAMKRDAPLRASRKSSEWNLDIIHMLVHDLKSPLSSIRALSNLTQTRIQEGNVSEGLHFLTLIDSVEEDATQLIETLLGLLELSGTAFTLEREPVNLSDLLRSRILRFSAEANEYTIALTTQLPDQAVWICADGSLLKQVIDNLLSNAIKFTPAKGEVTVRLSRQDDHVTLSVQDSGIGIPLKMQSQLFEKFTKARRPGVHAEKASGLGLSIVQKIVDIHRGKIYVASREHRGSTFTVELPIE